MAFPRKRNSRYVYRSLKLDFARPTDTDFFLISSNQQFKHRRGPYRANSTRVRFTAGNRVGEFERSRRSGPVFRRSFRKRSDHVRS